MAYCSSVKGPRVKLASCKSALNPTVASFCLDLSVSSSSWGLGRAAVCDCDTPWTFLLPFFTLLTVRRRLSRFQSYSLLICDLFYEAICFMSCLVLFILVFFSPFSIASTSFREERANLSAFSTFVRVSLVSSSSLCLGRAGFVIVALSGFFSYLFFRTKMPF